MMRSSAPGLRCRALVRGGRGAGATRLALILLLAAGGGQPSTRAIAEGRAEQWAQILKSALLVSFANQTY